MSIHRRPWTRHWMPTVIHGHPWASVGTRGRPRTSICRYPWAPVGIHQHLWASADAHGHPWAPVGGQGHLWATVGPIDVSQRSRSTASRQFSGQDPKGIPSFWGRTRLLPGEGISKFSNGAGRTAVHNYSMPENDISMFSSWCGPTATSETERLIAEVPREDSSSFSSRRGPSCPWIDLPVVVPPREIISASSSG